MFTALCQVLLRIEHNRMIHFIKNFLQLVIHNGMIDFLNIFFRQIDVQACWKAAFKQNNELWYWVHPTKNYVKDAFKTYNTSLGYNNTVIQPDVYHGYDSDAILASLDLDLHLNEKFHLNLTACSRWTHRCIKIMVLGLDINIDLVLQIKQQFITMFKGFNLKLNLKS